MVKGSSNMRQIARVSMAALALAGMCTAHAQDHMDHQAHMAVAGGDARELANYPSQMRLHTLATMRGHLNALSEILAAMSSGRYADAAHIAYAQLGMDSPSAAECKVQSNAGSPQMSAVTSMDQAMSQYMPEGMRKIGLEMHGAASAFAAEAAKAGKTGNAQSALTALSRVTQQCVACHAAYRLQ
jgi:hypothetical protein